MTDEYLIALSFHALSVLPSSPLTYSLSFTFLFIHLLSLTLSPSSSLSLSLILSLTHSLCLCVSERKDEGGSSEVSVCTEEVSQRRLW